VEFFFTALGGVVGGGRIGLGAKMAERINSWNSSTERSDNLKRVNTRVATTRCVVIRTAALKVNHVKN
jgi:hypothetical protein